MSSTEQFPQLIFSLAVPATEAAARAQRKEPIRSSEVFSGVVLQSFIDLTSKARSLAVRNLLFPRYVVQDNSKKEPGQPTTVSVVFVRKDQAEEELPLFPHFIDGTMVRVSRLQILPQFQNPDDLTMTRQEYETALKYRTSAEEVVSRAATKFPAPIETIQIAGVRLAREKDPNFEATASYPKTKTNQGKWREPFEDWVAALRIVSGIELQASADNVISARRFWQERSGIHLTGIYWGIKARRESLTTLAEATRQISAETAKKPNSNIVISRIDLKP